ncbi:MAG: gluconeogenesis factor YvcK family protein [Candidatus Methylomirabilis sp.]
MSKLRYTVEYDHRFGLYRWQIAPGQRLLPTPVAAARRFPRLVALGDGAGLAILLQSLKAALFAPGSAWSPGAGGERLTAIVSVGTDRDGAGCLAPRECLVALFEGDATTAAIFDFPLNGTGEGQSQRLVLEPDGVSRALAAIEAADLIVLGPARLHASLIAVLRAKVIAEAIGRSKARVVLVMNLMTELGQTDGYTAIDHLLAIRSHASAVRIHDVLFNTAPFASDLLARYAAHGQAPVEINVEHLRAHGCRPIGRDLLGQGPMGRHDPAKLARAVLELVRT